jgi:hypothetical protein
MTSWCWRSTVGSASSFASLSAMYDALFALGQQGNARAVAAAVGGRAPGTERIREGTRATVRWCAENRALAQLLYWRVVPGFEPSVETFAAGVQGMEQLREEFSEAVRLGQLEAGADSDDAVWLLTVQMSGLITQQFANEPDATFEQGAFTQLTDQAIDLVLDHYRRRRDWCSRWTATRSPPMSRHPRTGYTPWSPMSRGHRSSARRSSGAAGWTGPPVQRPERGSRRSTGLAADRHGRTVPSSSWPSLDVNSPSPGPRSSPARSCGVTGSRGMVAANH